MKIDLPEPMKLPNHKIGVSSPRASSGAESLRSEKLFAPSAGLHPGFSRRGIKNILDRFHKADFEIYIVGGAVRDILMGKIVSDWDFTTNATPEEILKITPGGLYNNKFGTVFIPNLDDETKPHEITTYRREEGYTDSRHPDKITWGKTLEEDLSRRDFTINALALDKNLTVIDLYKGQEDIKNKLVRAVRDPNERFSEDALRMMRAVRIAAELGFTI